MGEAGDSWVKIQKIGGNEEEAEEGGEEGEAKEEGGEGESEKPEGSED